MVAVMEGGTDLTLMVTMIGTGVTVLAGLATFGAFFLRRIETLIRDTKTELQSEIQGVRSEVRGVRKETRTEFASVRSEIQGMRSEVQGVRKETRTEFASVRSEIQGVRSEVRGVRKEMGTEFASVRSEIQGVRTDLGPRIDGVNSRVDQVFLAVSGLASEQAAASKPERQVKKRPPAA